MAGARSSQPLTDVLSVHSLRSSLSPSLTQSIREAHHHLLAEEGLEDAALQRRPPDGVAVEAHRQLSTNPEGWPPPHDDVALRVPSSHNHARESSPTEKGDAHYHKVDADLSTHEVVAAASIGLKMWNPFWLSRLVLCSFIALFALLIIALALLSHFATVNNGLGTQITANHYSWTYGPTAGTLPPKSRRPP